MNLEPNEDQKLLFDTVDALLAKHYAPEFRAHAVTGDLGWSATVWSALAELGLTGLTIAEEYDGVGAGPAEAFVVLQALGRHAAVEPLLDGAFVPSWLIGDLGTEAQRSELLPRLAAGSDVFAVAHAEPNRVWDRTPSVTATATEDGVVLDGVKAPVPHADQAAVLLVTAVDADGQVGVYLVDKEASGIARVDGRATDWTHASDITFTATPATVLGVVGDAAQDALARTFARARIAVAGEAIGLAESALRDTVEYLKQRKQFGAPLKVFQALVFRAVDVYAEVELARSFALWATAVTEAGGADPAVADDSFVFVSDMAKRAAEESIQLHGGIGMTFEAAVAHYAARLIGITQSYGGVAATRRRALRSAQLVTIPEALVN
ncbi:acyl-CoA dehydrogenase family protein [Nocardia altamirensis]|uniref:acyl-CoA dehydrogenase family protein n=1 Tax=Nocardia altamirensis TaxID=472158 RepID=UPI0008408A6E|nr:acyl-CoA dehydrogenase family protein [Nocardia altamirensis]